jgi:hypothetical protein
MDFMTTFGQRLKKIWKNINDYSRKTNQTNLDDNWELAEREK